MNPKEHPIIFSCEMVKAILEGRKTMTRRIVKPQSSGECPYNVGDKLWVREKWKRIGAKIRYAASFDDTCGAWKPSIYLPRWASRIMLEIIDIKIDRLQAISEEDAKEEGVEASKTVTTKDGSPCYTLPFQNLWTNLYGIDDNLKSWEADPMVWVIKFRILELIPYGMRS